MRRSSRQYAAAFLDAVEAAPDALTQLAKNLVVTISRRRQRKLLPAIMRQLEQLWNERHGVTAVRVTTQQPVSQAELSKHFTHQHAVAAATDSDLIGGAVIERGDQRFDASLTAGLKRLRTHLTNKES